MQHATSDEIELFLKKMGKRGMDVLSTLGKLQPFVDAMKTDLGQALLGELSNTYEQLLEKVSNVSATPEERMEFTITKRILLNYAQKISDYETRIKVIKSKGTA